MPVLCTHDRCTGCGACAQVCSRDSIQMVPDAGGFLYPEIDKSRCVECGICGKACPVQNQTQVQSLRQAYAACHQNDSVRQRSSSGGVFTAIAEKVIDAGGVVFGVRLDERMRAVHDYADTKEALSAFRGSKYVQSDLNDGYKLAKEFLDDGRLVLFTGTPCQIAGLLASLPRKYDNLICQDIICHGVPAPLAWERYLAELEESYGTKTEEVCFRDKSNGWKNYCMQISFANGETCRKERKDNLFMYAFLGDYCLRTSCYQCAFKQEDRLADLTLADFWGIDHVMPEMNDDRGTSLVLVHSERGSEMLKQVEEKLRIKPVDWKKALSYNGSMTDSAGRPANRERFVTALHKMRFSEAVRKYCRPALLESLPEKCSQIRMLPNRILLRLLGDAQYQKLKKLLKRE